MFATIAYCVGIALAFIIVIYVGTDGGRRNDPAVARLRCIRVLVLSALTPVFVNFVLDKEFYKGHGILEILGVRTVGFWQALTLPLLLTVIFYLGPVILHFFVEGYANILLEPNYWIISLQDPLWIRDQICAPLVEEICFRSCILPLLFPHLGAKGSILLGPTLFGLCHVHHLRERWQRSGLKSAIITTLVQLSYTTLFGIYASYIFIRTGHILPCILVHSFCNYMGLPEAPPSDKPSIMFAYILGFILWCLLIGRFTDPVLYGNVIYSVMS